MSLENVVTLSGTSFAAENGRAIGALKEALALAEGGEIDGVVIVLSHINDSISFGMEGMYSHSMVGALEQIKVQLLEDLK